MVAWVGVSGSIGDAQPALAIPAQQMSTKSILGKEIEQGKGWVFSSTFYTPGNPKTFMQHWERSPSVVAPQTSMAAITCSLSLHRLCPRRVEAALPWQGILVILHSVQKACWDFCCPFRQPTRDVQEGTGHRISLAESPADCSASGWAETCRAMFSWSFSALCPLCPEMHHLQPENETSEEQVRTFLILQFPLAVSVSCLAAPMFWEKPSSEQLPSWTRATQCCALGSTVGWSEHEYGKPL